MLLLRRRTSKLKGLMLICRAQVLDLTVFLPHLFLYAAYIVVNIQAISSVLPATSLTW
jgi:hypothetical protein